jgi:hypothetical protein
VGAKGSFQVLFTMCMTAECAASLSSICPAWLCRGNVTFQAYARWLVVLLMQYAAVCQVGGQ